MFAKVTSLFDADVTSQRSASTARRRPTETQQVAPEVLTGTHTEAVSDSAVSVLVELICGFARNIANCVALRRHDEDLNMERIAVSNTIQYLLNRIGTRGNDWAQLGEGNPQGSSERKFVSYGISTKSMNEAIRGSLVGARAATDALLFADAGLLEPYMSELFKASQNLVVGCDPYDVPV